VCGVCGGTGIPAGDCDCDGNQLDALGVCGGDCDNDADGDGICDNLEILGCGIPWACNYNENSTDISNLLCTFTSGCNICNQGVVITYDVNNNGICDYDEVTGCTVSQACNYNPIATLESGLCEFESCVGCTDTNACTFDAAATVNSSAMCVYAETPFLDCYGNCLQDNDNDGICNNSEYSGCTDPSAMNYTEWATEENGTCVYGQLGCVLPFACNYDSIATLLDVEQCVFPPCSSNIIQPSPSPVCSHPNACNFLELGSCEFTSCLSLGCTDENACNFEPSALWNDGTCNYTICIVPGCTLESACNYDFNATVNDGSCEWIECSEYLLSGCTVPVACNFNPLAGTNDGSCEYESCSGCTSPSACNFNPLVSLSSPLDCIYPAVGYGCNGSCLEDVNENYVCDVFEVQGCTNPGSCNYNPAAYVENGSCLWPDECGICGGPGAIYPCGCTLDGCDFCLGDFNEDEIRSTADLLILLSNFGCLYDCQTDLTWDDVVGVDDLLVFLSVFASQCD
jgi:hypothetical protein